MTTLFFIGLLICLVGILGIAISAAGVNISQILDKKKRVLAVVTGSLLMFLAYVFTPTYYFDNDKDGHGNPNTAVKNIFGDRNADYVLTKDDANDDNPEVWNSGDAIAYYEDRDGDGYGNKNAKPVYKNKDRKYDGFADNNFDCCDEDANTHPFSSGQPIPWFQVRNKCGSFDYDCNNEIEKRYNSLAQCICQGIADPRLGHLAGTNAFHLMREGYVNKIPEPGVPDSYCDKCDGDGNPIYEPRMQEGH